jgi:hypothetical protein
MEDEIYNPEIPIYYNYNVKNILNKELHDPDTELNNYNNIYLCGYNINFQGKLPFLTFLLIKTKLDEYLNFPKIEIHKDLNSTNLLNHTILLLQLLLKTNFIEFNKLVEINELIEFNGFYKYNNNLYIYINITKLNIQLNDIYRKNNVWFALVDEIVNHKHLCNININNEVSNYFINNMYFCFIKDINNLNFEIPIVNYVSKPANKLNFIYTFGQTRCADNNIFGPYFYFTNFFNAINYSSTHIEDYNKLLCTNDIKDGIVRFAIFTGLTKYVENSLNDDVDESDIKTKKLENSTLYKNIDFLTMRITDYNSKWTQNYNSIYLGNIQLDDDTILKNNILVLKEYNQQIPLSYHYINKKSLNFQIL